MLKTKVAIDVYKESKNNTYIRVRILDEYSFEKDIEKVIDEVLR